jgi:hypothetical protein
MPQHIRQYGLNAQGQQNKEPSEWEKMLAQARMVTQMDNETALGFALGRGLHKLWMDHLAARHAKQDTAEAAKAKQNNEIQSGNISDIDAFRKANGNLPDPTLNVPENWQDAPVSVVDSQGNINPSFAPQEVPAQYVPQHEVVDTTGVILDPTTQSRALLNQMTVDAVNGNLSDNDLRQALAGRGYWR